MADVILGKVRTALWLVAGIGLVVRTAVRDRGVIYDHLEFGRRLFSGTDLYAPHLGAGPLHPVYPPSFAWMTAPFALFPDPVARTLWAIVQVLALAWIGVWLVRTISDRWPELRRHRHTALFLTALLASRYILRDTHGGGGNLINVALVLGALHTAGKGCTKTAAALLGLSLATKPTMVLFVPLIWLFGNARAATGALLVTATLMASALWVHGQGLAPLIRWVDGSLAYGQMADVFATPDAGFPPFTWMNQCLRCAIARFGGTVPEQFAAKVPGFFPGLGLDPSTLSWLRHLLSIAILAATFSVAWRRRHEPLGRSVSIGALFAASLLLSPISWKAHHVGLIPALFCLVSWGLRGHHTAWLLAALYAITCVAGEAVVGKDFKNVQQSLYLTTFGTLGIWALCLTRTFAPSTRESTPRSPPSVRASQHENPSSSHDLPVLGR